MTPAELSFKFRTIIGTMKRGAKGDFTVVPLPNQIKIIGFFNQHPDISSYVIEFAPDVARKFVDYDLPVVVAGMKDRFYKFSRQSYKYNVPYEHYTAQTVFYTMSQTCIKILETVSCHTKMPRSSSMDIATIQDTQDHMQEHNDLSSPPILVPNTPFITPEGQMLMPPPPLPPFDFIAPRKRSHSPE